MKTNRSGLDSGSKPRLMRFFMPSIIVVAVVALVNVFLRSEGAPQIAFAGGDYSAVIGTTIMFLVVIGMIQLFMRRGSRGRYDKLNSYLEEERVANQSRKREIDFSLIVNTNFPQAACTIEDPSHPLLYQKQERARAQSHNEMMKLNLTNIQLKHAYGPQNLDRIARAETNFNAYVQALQEWAEALEENGRHQHAVLPLEEAVAVGADTSRTFIMLADLYKVGGQVAKLGILRSKASKPDFLPEDSFTKTKILAHIDALVGS